MLQVPLIPGLVSETKENSVGLLVLPEMAAASLADQSCPLLMP